MSTRQGSDNTIESRDGELCGVRHTHEFLLLLAPLAVVHRADTNGDNDLVGARIFLVLEGGHGGGKVDSPDTVTRFHRWSYAVGLGTAPQHERFRQSEKQRQRPRRVWSSAESPRQRRRQDSQVACVYPRAAGQPAERFCSVSNEVVRPLLCVLCPA